MPLKIPDGWHAGLDNRWSRIVTIEGRNTARLRVFLKDTDSYCWDMQESPLVLWKPFPIAIEGEAPTLSEACSAAERALCRCRLQIA